MEFEKICEIIADVMDISPEGLTRETTFVDDLGADSLDIFKVSMSMEEVFDVEFNSTEFDNAKTIGDVVDVVCRLS